MNFLDIVKNLNMETLKKKSEDMISSLKSIECTGEAGAGFVKVTIDGNFNLLSIDFDVNNELIKDDLVMLRDLIIAAYNDASAKMREEIQKKVSNLFVSGIF